ncbi:MAG TPA: FG-GAP-like repeat-containing protein [Phycisphaerae bacterium]|nr:FG-GAP-like repeat-containing protein [Phycisphaerae bacterium]
MTTTQTRTQMILLMLCATAMHAMRANAANFTLKASVTGSGDGQVAWGDYDNDGDLDLLVVGTTSYGGTSDGIAKIFKYENGTFTEDTDASSGLYGVVSADADWGDFDNDGDLDLFITGQQSSDLRSRIYTNTNAMFNVKKTYHEYNDASGEWGDADNDGDLDLLIAGDYIVWPGGGKFLRVFEFDGAVFKPGPSFAKTHDGSVEWGDFDNDGDMDVLATGEPAYPSRIAKVFENTGSGYSVYASMAGVEGGDASFGDFDGDGDLDVVVCGSGTDTRVYENTGSGFTAVFTTTQLWYSQAAWGDYDNDGDLDLLIAGTSTGAFNGTISRIYRNDGGGAFSVDSAASNAITNLYYASVAWGDYDRDGDLDLAINGFDGLQNAITRIYENDAADTGAANTPPQPPANLQRTLLGTSIQFSWSPGSDAETPTAGLTYNLRVGTYPGGGNVVGSMTIDGQSTRLVDEYGNTNHNLNWTIHNLTDGPYYWSVQTIDSSFAPSAFVSSGPVFVIPPDNDVCTDAIDVVNGSYAFENLAASNDGPSEPTTCDFVQNGQIGADIWYRYTPACDGTVHISLCDSDFDTAMAVYYAGGACPIGESASFCNDDSCGTRSELDVPGEAGEPFMIRVGGYNGAIGHGTLEISQSAVSNDYCENAIPNSGDILSASSNLGCATNDGTASCGAADNSDVWYAYTAPMTGMLRVRTCSTHDSGGVDAGTDTIVSVYSDCPGSGGTELACNDDWTDGNYRNACPGSDVGVTRDSALAMPINEDETVYIRVSHYSLGLTGNINLVAFVSPPNDDCAAAETITDGQTLGTTVYSTNEGTSSSGSSALNTDVWYEYTATCDGLLRANTCGSAALDSVNTVLSILDACPEVGDIHELAINNDVAQGNDSNACGGATLDSAIIQPVTLGERVMLRVSRYATSSSGEFLLNVACMQDCNSNSVPDIDESDSDGDTIIDGCDVCAGFDDRIDTDDDGIPDGCDDCAGGLASGDVDGNGAIDLADYSGYDACLAGPASGSGGGCECFDFDADGDIDLADFAELQIRRD